MNKRTRLLTGSIAAIVLLAVVCVTGLAGGNGQPQNCLVDVAFSVSDFTTGNVSNGRLTAKDGNRAAASALRDSEVTPAAHRHGWRRCLGLDSSAMKRPALSKLEGRSPSAQFDLRNDVVLHDCDEYLHDIEYQRVDRRDAMLGFDSTKALLREVRPSDIDDSLEPIATKKLLYMLTTESNYLD